MQFVFSFPLSGHPEIITVLFTCFSIPDPTITMGGVSSRKPKPNNEHKTGNLKNPSDRRVAQRDPYAKEIMIKIFGIDNSGKTTLLALMRENCPRQFCDGLSREEQRNALWSAYQQEVRGTMWTFIHWDSHLIKTQGPLRPMNPTIQEIQSKYPGLPEFLDYYKDHSWCQWKDRGFLPREYSKLWNSSPDIIQKKYFGLKNNIIPEEMPQSYYIDTWTPLFDQGEYPVLPYFVSSLLEKLEADTWTFEEFLRVYIPSLRGFDDTPAEEVFLDVNLSSPGTPETKKNISVQELDCRYNFLKNVNFVIYLFPLVIRDRTSSTLFPPPPCPPSPSSIFLQCQNPNALRFASPSESLRLALWASCP